MTPKRQGTSSRWKHIRWRIIIKISPTSPGSARAKE